MPLNLSTKHNQSSRSSNNSTPVQNRSGSGANIWSPASMCEKETLITEIKAENILSRFKLKSEFINRCNNEQNYLNFKPNFEDHRKDFSMLQQNRTDIFVVNNNNNEKEIARPDSTAHSDSGRISIDEKKRERSFQVSSDFFYFLFFDVCLTSGAPRIFGGFNRFKKKCLIFSLC